MSSTRAGATAELSPGAVLRPDHPGPTRDLGRPERRRPRERGLASSSQARLGLAGLLGTGLIISLSAGQTDLLLPKPVRPLPRYLAGPFGSAGLHLGLAALIVVFTLMFVSYVVTIRAADQLSGRTVLLSIAGLSALVLLAPPLLSTDIFSYAAYGRMGALYGFNPYLHGPSSISFVPLYAFVGYQWISVPTAYSPLFTAVSYVLAPLGITASVLAYKGIAAVSCLVMVVVVWNTARLRDLNPVKAVALVGLNPVIVIYGVGGGHNDLLMLSLLVTAVYLLLLRKERTSGALIVAATAIKLTAGLLLPFALADSVARPGGSRDRRAVLVGAGIAAAVIAAFAFPMFGTGPLHLLGTLKRVQSQAGLQSIPGAISIGLGFGGLSSVAELVLTAGCGVGIVYLLRRVWRGELDWITGAGWATFILLITAGSLLPWYMTWLVPLAALSRDRRLFLAAIVMTGLGLTSL